MTELLFATHNQNKVEEIRALLPQFKVLSLKDVNFNEEIEETGTTLEENASLKAQTVFEKTGKACFADDTGLEVVALNGDPGVYSARYAGEPANSENNMDKLLAALDGENDRSAAFRTVISFVDENGLKINFEGSVEGEILMERTGNGGFGYDPVFKPNGYEQSFAEMTPVQKNEISHRGRAINRFVEYLRMR